MTIPYQERQPASSLDRRSKANCNLKLGLTERVLSAGAVARDRRLSGSIWVFRRTPQITGHTSGCVALDKRADADVLTVR